MKTSFPALFIVMTVMLAACQTASPPPPVTISEGVEFTLAPDQAATLTDTDLTLRLIRVAGDERCPSEIECAASGPVSISLSAQMGDEESTSINLQTFTDNNGRAPDIEFEGIVSSVVYEGYLIRVAGVLPYPANLTNQIKNSEYRISLVVSRQ